MPVKWGCVWVVLGSLAILPAVATDEAVRRTTPVWPMARQLLELRTAEDEKDKSPGGFSRQLSRA